MSDAKASSDTPLSDLIAAHIESSSLESWDQFLDGFRKSQVGVVAFGAPAGTVGEFLSTPDHPISVGLTLHAGGRPMALAFADPKAFAARFGQRFNAVMAGEALLATILLNPECAGVLINSALSEMSVVIDRATADAMARSSRRQSEARPWWKFW